MPGRYAGGMTASALDPAAIVTGSWSITWSPAGTAVEYRRPSGGRALSADFPGVLYVGPDDRLVVYRTDSGGMGLAISRAGGPPEHVADFHEAS